MQDSPHDPLDLLREHHALVRAWGRAQTCCTDQLRRQAAEIERLQAQAIRLRAAVVIRETALDWARADRKALELAVPGLARRVTLARRVDALLARIQDLMRERWWKERTERHAVMPSAVLGQGARPADAAQLEASLVAADLVICQTGCLSHGDYWRVQDHCKRTGKACVLVEAPEAVRIVRIRKSAEGEGPARIATLQPQASE